MGEALNVAADPTFVEIAAWLNRRTEEGWRLVAVTSADVYIFERPRKLMK